MNLANGHLQVKMFDWNDGVHTASVTMKAHPTFAEPFAPNVLFVTHPLSTEDTIKLRNFLNKHWPVTPDEGS